MRGILAVAVLAVLATAQRTPELVVSVGHAGEAMRMAFAGDYLASAAWSQVVVIDLRSGLVVHRRSEGALVQALEASPAGDLIAIGSCAHAIRVVNVRSNTIVRSFEIPQECAESVAFSSDAAFLAAGAYGCGVENGLQIWDLTTGKLARVLARGAGVRSVAFAGNGGWVAAVEDNGRGRLFEWPSGRELRHVDGLEHAGSSEAAAITSRDGRYFGWRAGGLRVWDVRAGSEIMLDGVRDTLILAAEFLDDGRLAYVSGENELIVQQLAEGPRQAVLLPWPASSGDVQMMARGVWLRIRRDGRLLAGSRNARIHTLDVATGRLRDLSAPTLTYPRSLRWSKRGLIAWGDFESGLRGWQDEKGRPLNIGTGRELPVALAFSPDGARLVVAGTTSVSTIDVARGHTLASTEVEASSDIDVAFSPDGSHVAFASGDTFGLYDGRLRLTRRIAPLEKYTSVQHVAFSPDAHWIAAGLVGPHPALRVWPADRAAASISLDETDVIYSPQPPAFSRDSRWLASFRRGSSVTVWATTTWRVARSWTIPGNGQALAFSPEGSRLAVASDREAAIWDAATARKLVTFAAAAPILTTEIAWSPDSGRVVTSADDGVLRFWNPLDGRLLGSLYVLQSNNEWLLVAADGRIDGSDSALARTVAWRTGDVVAADERLTKRYRSKALWQALRPAATSDRR